MSKEQQKIYIIPLNLVLFPHGSTQIHVTEKSLIESVQHCYKNNQPIGVTLIREQKQGSSTLYEPYLIGTASKINSLEEDSKGNIMIQISGEKRFRIRKFEENTESIAAIIEFLEDDEVENTPMLDALTYKAQEVFKEYVDNMLSETELNIDIFYPKDATTLSFMIASLLPFDNKQKQKMLEMTDSIERIRELVKHLVHQSKEAEHSKIYKLDSKQLKDWIYYN